MLLPTKVTIYEVGPRDGLQNETRLIPTHVKLDLINRLSESGLRFIEASAFVSPKWVPQMADHNEIMTTLMESQASKNGIHYPALVPNQTGFDAALQTNVTDIAVFAAASESFSRKNINMGIEDSLRSFRQIIEQAHQANIRVRGYVSCIAGCPYEGKVPAHRTAEIAARLLEAGCYEISLGDTIGVGTPNQISEILDHVLATDIPVEALALHCHDTYGMAIANIYEGLRHGVSVFDSSVGGLGGCPYAPGAAGNVATEKLLYLLDGLGIETGVQRDKILEIATFIRQEISQSPSKT